MNIGKALEEILRPQTYPLAVELAKDESEFPEGTRRPEEKLALCQALTLCRGYGWTMGITKEDSGCPAVNIAYGWSKIVDESVVAQFFLGAGYTSDEAGAKRIVDDWDRLKPGKCGGVVVSPLTRTKIASMGLKL